MFLRLANWLIKHSRKTTITRTDPQGRERVCKITPEQALAIETIMRGDAPYMVFFEYEREVWRVSKNMRYDIICATLRDIAASHPDFTQALTDLVIDLNNQ